MLKSKLLSRIAGITHGFLDPTEQPPADFVRVQQVHGSLVLPASADNFAQCATTQADGIITPETRAVAVQTADCLPVLYATRDAKIVAAVHAGWRGLHKGILLEAVKQFEAKGYAPNDLVIAIGPAIGPCCFEVDASVQEAFAKDWGRLWQDGASPLLKKQPKSVSPGRSQAKVSQNNLWIDLDRIARLQLVEAGVPDAQIEDVGNCTYCGEGERASFRRATHEGIKAARQWSFACRVPSSPSR